MGGIFLCLSKLRQPETQPLLWIELLLENPSRQDIEKPDVYTPFGECIRRAFLWPQVVSRTHTTNITSLTTMPNNDQTNPASEEVVIFVVLAERGTTAAQWDGL